MTSATSLSDGHRSSTRVTAAPQKLFERTDELAHIEAQLALAAQGQSGLVLITGPAGIGKTALCDAAVGSARHAGMRVLSARGGELETGFSFGVVRQLVEPLLATATGAERRGLLAGAAERALVALEGEDDVDAPTPFGVIHGLYWLTVNAGTAAPLVIIIDDAQWIDRASLRWLLYIAERLESLRIALVLAFRPGESEDADLLARLEQMAGQRNVAPSPLTITGARALLERVFDAQCSEHFVERCHTVTGGNPFLLAELAHALRADGAEPDDAAAERLLEVAPDAVGRAVGLRIARQGSDAVEVARAVAVLGDGAPLHQVAALAGLEIEDAGACADRLAAIGVLEPAVPLRFVHAITRSAVYEDMAAAERAVRHGAAARSLASLHADPEQVCAQLLRTEPAAAAEAVAQLRDGAHQALGRGAPDSAVTYLLRAVDECAERAQRSTVLRELGLAERLLVDFRAAEHLREALELCDDSGIRAEIAAELADVLATTGQWDAALAVIDGVPRPPVSDRSDLSNLENVWAFLAAADPQRVEEFERFLAELLDGLGSARDLTPAAAALVAPSLANRCERIGLARETFSHALTSGFSYPGGQEISLVRLCNAALALGEQEALEQLVEEILDSHRPQGALAGINTALAYRAAARCRKGELYGAEEDLRAAVEFVQAHWPRTGPIAVPWLGVDALIERPEELEELIGLVSAVELPPDLDRTAMAALLYETRGRLALAEGNIAEARAALRQAASLFEALGIKNPNFSAWRSALALTLDDREEALILARGEFEDARLLGAPRTIGIGLRTIGMLEGGEEGISRLREAVEVLAGSPARLEQARALVELGAALRRANHRVEAREPLRAGLDLAHRCGATRLSEHARTELRATGARPRRAQLSGAEALTAAERRVAGLAASGMSNPEIAQALFVTINTVEGHLRHAYQKLSISSRTELPDVLSTPVGTTPK
jgi:DNA-binding CsgD family transcriptional regulator